ncbi:hypothetical protein GCM10027416_15110 [Okibacterium endophyticum]
MSFATILVTEAATHHVELPMPPFMYGVVALIVFAVLGIVTYSFRDVANRYAARVDARAGRRGDAQATDHE